MLKPPKAPKPKVMGATSSPMNKQIKKETLQAALEILPQKKAKSKQSSKDAKIQPSQG